MIDPEGLMEVILDHYGITPRAGKISCPFGTHADRTPSCSVHLRRGVFHCFTCEAAGGIYAFIELMEGVDRDTARQRAQSISGGCLPPVSGVSRGGGAGLPPWARSLAGAGGGALPDWARA